MYFKDHDPQFFTSTKAINATSTNFTLFKGTKIQIHIHISQKVFSNEGGPSSPSSMPIICNVDFINHIIHCAATTI